MKKISDRNNVKYDDVKIGEYVDMGAGCFLERTEDKWMQWDGGYGIEVSEDDVRSWLD